ncbi:uncharacterized protein GGS22DRAFT_77062 [Annulohypoxylon maeteangense]|uniref:uncharacterized protein n=1 Tax=Annulohypoxylon maeteangense TaxID=1927788 RepID=UPI0020074DB9|nr:uncharacterized protein GGS22DRAFT_77062 [Annulohypoxylon maeteangense]KAI0880849.1 hypothetical protein GGS22DRAFT_77062 [Annulohypoxylon maeteangense]
MAFLQSVLSKSRAQVSRQRRNIGSWSAIPGPASNVINASNANIFERDVCSDAFGSSRSNSICSPSNTLCCVQKGEVFPSCQQELGIGWCCVGNGTNQDCYVDQPSVCGSENSVACVNLAPNTTSACCPRLTRCSAGYQAAEGNVRCEIGYADLMQLAATASQTNAFSTDISSTTSSISTTSTSSSSPVPTQSNSQERQQSQSSISSGATAGIAVGAAGFIILVILAFYFLHRRRKAKMDETNNISNNINNTNDNYDYNNSSNVYMNDNSEYSSRFWQYNTDTQGSRNPSELASIGPPKELPHNQPLGELPG